MKEETYFLEDLLTQFQLISCVALNGTMIMNKESESVLTGALFVRFNQGTCIEKLRKTTKGLNQDL
jgi:hypothetical protein